MLDIGEVGEEVVVHLRTGSVTASDGRPNSGRSARPHWVLRLQRQIGNAATTAALREAGPAGARLAVPVVQRKDTAFQMPAPPPGMKALGDVERSGSKKLTAGTMAWTLFLTYDGIADDEDAYQGKASAIMQIVFTPNTPSKAGLSFLQTVAAAKVGKTGTAKVDAKPDDYDPFYGPQWDPDALDWTPEMAVPEHRRSQSSTPADPSAYLYDEPSVRPGGAKRFESVVVDVRSGAILGSLRWGVGGGRLIDGTSADCTDRPSGAFEPAVDSFYATPTSGTAEDAGPRFEAILAEFRGDDATLSPEHKADLDRVAVKAKAAQKDPKFHILVSGHGDAMDPDPMDAAKRRSDAAVAYLVQAGVLRTAIRPTAFGDKWARAAVSMKEGRNRRVQVRLRYPD
jgi:outer membrane protein OmpA-like peptidoglycan-associated protein